LAQARKIQYANYQDIKRNHTLINLFKIAIPANYGITDRNSTLPKHQIFIIPPGKICTETYIIISSFVTQQEAERFQSYLQTNFARYLLKIRKIAQSVTREFWQFVPFMPTDIFWTDKMLFEHFNLNEAEQEHILNHVRELS
jgi:site-specific DNA-methyltransferase (adenine-specific)